MFDKTSTKHSPWIVINSNNKLTARLNAIRYMLEAIEYEHKSNLENQFLNLDKERKKIMLEGVVFDDLTQEQYMLLNNINRSYNHSYTAIQFMSLKLSVFMKY